MKTLVTALAGACLALPLAAQTPTTTQQLLAARDTVWHAWFANAPMASSLYTYRVFDPERKVWHLVGANSKGSSLIPGLTWADADGRSGIEWYGNVLVRFRYFALTPTHFLWRQDQSHDGGKTWRLDTGAMDARRIGK